VQIDIASGNLTEYDIPYTLPVLGFDVLPADALGAVALSCVVQPGKNGVLASAQQRRPLAVTNMEIRKSTPRLVSEMSLSSSILSPKT
jgi:hypothetical protein